MCHRRRCRCTCHSLSWLAPLVSARSQTPPPHTTFSDQSCLVCPTEAWGIVLPVCTSYMMDTKAVYCCSCHLQNRAQGHSGVWGVGLKKDNKDKPDLELFPHLSFSPCVVFTIIQNSFFSRHKVTNVSVCTEKQILLLLVQFDLKWASATQFLSFLYKLISVFSILLHLWNVTFVGLSWNW